MVEHAAPASKDMCVLDKGHKHESIAREKLKHIVIDHIDIIYHYYIVNIITIEMI